MIIFNSSLISSGIQSLRSVPHEYKTSFKVKFKASPSCDRSLQEEYNTLGLSHCGTLATFLANCPEGLKESLNRFSADDCKLGLSFSDALVP